MMTKRSRLWFAVIVGILCGIFCAFALSRIGNGAGDFGWSLRAARDLLAGNDPYGHPPGPSNIPYPLPTALLAIPLTGLKDFIAGGDFFWHKQWNSGLVNFKLRTTLAVIDIPVVAFSLCVVLCSMGSAYFVFVLRARFPARVADETTNRPATCIDSTSQLAGYWIDLCARDRIFSDLSILAFSLARTDILLSGNYSTFICPAARTIDVVCAPAL